MRLFVLDPHPIFRHGLVASLRLIEGVESVDHCASPGAAQVHPALRDADVVIVDSAAPGAVDVITMVRARTGAAVLVCTADTREPVILAALRAGARGYIAKDGITQERLQTTLRAVAAGASVIGDGLLAHLVTSRGAPAAGELHLTERERDVLALIADGRPTREIAVEMSYSERTVKNVLHDVVTRLGVRSRSHAVAQAVRAGLI